MRILRYIILKPVTLIQVPDNSDILDIKTRRDKICIWMLVDETAPLVTRTFQVYGTGREINMSAEHHIGTVMSTDHSLVWHIFEVK